MTKKGYVMTRRSRNDAEPTPGVAPRLGGHIVLDLLNTVEYTDTGLVDHLSVAESVHHWLEESGISIETPPRGIELVTAIIDLREVVRTLVLHRLAGTSANPAELNSYLEAAGGYWTLRWETDAKAPQRKFVYKEMSIKTVLAPLAEAAAELLAREDFSAVKRCANPECSRFFYDPSATSRRRWCDMSSCGNRMKVTAFRQRQRPLL